MTSARACCEHGAAGRRRDTAGRTPRTVAGDRRRGWATRLVAAGALATMLAAGAAGAHQQGVSYSDVTVEDGQLRYDLTITTHDLANLDADRNGALSDEEVLAGYPSLRRSFATGLTVEAGGEPCTLALQDFVLDPTGAVTFRLRGRCPPEGPLRVHFGLLAATGSDGYDLAKIRYRGALSEHVFTRADTTVTVVGAEGLLATVRRFVFLGIEHIATGYDHMLFLVALLLTGGGVRALVGIVTAFTIAHSVTLALATFGMINLPTRLVESAIALSIAWVALENVVLDHSQARWRITFVFGLVHGFGFASVLREMHLPGQNLAASLLAFNLGVEAGQLAVVVAAYPLIVAVQRAPRRRAIVGATSAVILVVALYWFVERAWLS